MTESGLASLEDTIVSSLVSFLKLLDFDVHSRKFVNDLHSGVLVSLMGHFFVSNVVNRMYIYTYLGVENKDGGLLEKEVRDW